MRRAAQTIIEYALLLALLVLLIITILSSLGRRINDVFITVSNSLITSTTSEVEGGGEELPIPKG